MKTIEEKINEIVEGHAECRWLDANELREYLQKIATEQRKIDIAKAKEAFNKSCGWLAVYPWYNGVFEEFVKAMEG